MKCGGPDRYMKLEWGPRFTEVEKHRSIAAFCSCYLTGYATFILVLYSSIVSGFIFFYYLFLPVISLCAQQTTLHPVTVRKIVKCKESTQVQAELDEFNP